MAAVCIGVQYMKVKSGNNDWETMVFTVIVWGH